LFFFSPKTPDASSTEARPNRLTGQLSRRRFSTTQGKKKAAIRLPFYFHTIIGFPMPLKPVFKTHI
jgi:hypothetical protein